MKKSTWLKENIIEILALIIIGFVFYMFNAILFSEIKADSPVSISIVESLKGTLNFIIGFYFGSSIGSKVKQMKLDSPKEGIKEDIPA